MDAWASRLSWRRLPWVVEVVSIGIGYAIYSVIRVISPHRLPESLQHAASVTRVEQAFGVFHELGINEFVARHDALGLFSAYYYASLHFIVTPLVLAWIWKRRAPVYGQLRSALIIATSAALVVYATWPLAPPRFAVAGSFDTVMDHPVIWASGHGVEGFINDLAAMPSLHVGWAVWCAACVVTAFDSRWRHLAWCYPLATTFVVVATANHYVLDAVGGALVVAVPLYLCGLRLPGRLVGADAPAPAQEAIDLRHEVRLSA